MSDVSHVTERGAVVSGMLVVERCQCLPIATAATVGGVAWGVAEGVAEGTTTHRGDRAASMKVWQL